jgi:glycosyltransferase involved in cell wall biosynthesis
LFVFGSLTECQPLVILDAMAAGTPFISRSSGSIPYMSGGISVESPKDAATQIDRLLFDQNEWQILSNSGQKDAYQKFNPIKVKDALFSYITQFLN